MTAVNGGPKTPEEIARDEGRKLRTGERRIRVAELAAAGHKPGEIAAILGVHRTTIHDDLKDAWVVEQLQVMRTACLESLADTARDAAGEALRTLRDALTVDDPAIQVRAAQSILQALAPLMQQGDLNARMARLEREAGLEPKGVTIPATTPHGQGDTDAE